MCLISNIGKAVTANDDTVCYKIVRLVQENGEFVFRSTFYDFKYRIGKNYMCYDFKDDVSLIGRTTNAKKFIVECGFHSYSSFSYVAKQYAEQYSYNCFVVLKCVIPAGANMYTSTSYTEYCSDRIKVIGWTAFSPEKADNANNVCESEDSVEWYTLMPPLTEKRFSIRSFMTRLIKMLKLNIRSNVFIRG